MYKIVYLSSYAAYYACCMDMYAAMHMHVYKYN